MQRYRRQYWQRIATPTPHGAFQWQRSLGFSIRNEQTRWWLQLTGYCKLVVGGAPIVLEECLNVDDVAVLSDLGPKGMTSPHLDLRAHLGNRRSISAQI